MADDPTIEEAKRMLAHWHEVEFRMNGHNSSHGLYLRTLLASHASLEERVREAERLARPVAVRVGEYRQDMSEPDDTDPFSMLLPWRDFRALAAFVNEKET